MSSLKLFLSTSPCLTLHLCGAAMNSFLCPRAHTMRSPCPVPGPWVINPVDTVTHARPAATRAISAVCTQINHANRDSVHLHFLDAWSTGPSGMFHRSLHLRTCDPVLTLVPMFAVSEIKFCTLATEKCGKRPVLMFHSLANLEQDTATAPLPSLLNLQTEIFKEQPREDFETEPVRGR